MSKWPPPWPINRKREYLHWATRAADGLRGTNAELEKTLRNEIARGLEALTAAA